MIYHKKEAGSAQKTAAVLARGGIVILPTDTVYGFSGIADLCTGQPQNTDKKIRALKGRGEEKPFIHLIANPEDVFIYTNDKVPDSLLALWPGALTLIVSVKESSPLLHAMSTVALRCPADVWLRDVISHTGAPIYSTSANKSGFPILSEECDLIREFGEQVDALVLDGSKKQAVPSTVALLQDGRAKVVRQGSVIIPE